MNLLTLFFLFSYLLGAVPVLVISQHNSTLVQDAQLMLQQMIVKVLSLFQRFKSVLKLENALRYLCFDRRGRQQQYISRGRECH